MKSYSQFKTSITEGHNRYPGDDMTQKELQVAINSAQNILDMIDQGATIKRWQISAIVKASDEMASVYTSMSADMPALADMEYDEYGYSSSMYGESVSDHVAGYEKSKFDSGYRAQIKNHQGKTVYLSQHSFKTKDDAIKYANQYHTHVHVDGGNPDKMPKPHSSKLAENQVDEVSMATAMKVRDRGFKNMVRGVGDLVPNPKTGGKTKMYQEPSDKEKAASQRGTRMAALATRAMDRARNKAKSGRYEEVSTDGDDTAD